MDITKLLELLFKTKNFVLSLPVIIVTMLYFVGFDFKTLNWADPKLIIGSLFAIFTSLVLIHNTIMNKLTSIVTELSGYDTPDIKNLSEYLENISNDMDSILTTLTNLNNSISGVPSKAIIMQILLARVKMLMLSILENCTDYLCNIASKPDNQEFDHNQLKLQRFFEIEISKFIESIYMLSKDTLNKKINEDVIAIYKKHITKINDELVRPTRSENKLYSILNMTKDMEQEYKILFEYSILLPDDNKLNDDEC